MNHLHPFLRKAPDLRQLLCVVATWAMGTAAQAGVVTTQPLWNGTDHFGSFTSTLPDGPDSQPFGATVVGQSFVADSALGLVFNTFTFNVEAFGALDYRVMLYAWNGSSTVGDALFTSSTRTMAGLGSVNQTLAVGMGDTLLEDGVSYIALLTTVGEAQNTHQALIGGLLNNDAAYAGGTLHYGRFTSLSDLGATAWDYAGNIGDMAFTMDFSDAPTSAVPEPGSLALAGTALLALAGLRRTQRRLF